MKAMYLALVFFLFVSACQGVSPDAVQEDATNQKDAVEDSAEPIGADETVKDLDTTIVDIETKEVKHSLENW